MLIKAHRDCVEAISAIDAENIAIKKELREVRNYHYEAIMALCVRVLHLEDHLGMKNVDGKLLPIKKCESCHQEIKEVKENE